MAELADGKQQKNYCAAVICCFSPFEPLRLPSNSAKQFFFLSPSIPKLCTLLISSFAGLVSHFRRVSVSDWMQAAFSPGKWAYQEKSGEYLPPDATLLNPLSQNTSSHASGVRFSLYMRIEEGEETGAALIDRRPVGHLCSLFYFCRFCSCCSLPVARLIIY